MSNSGGNSGLSSSGGAREHREMSAQEMIDKLKELSASNPELAAQLNSAFKPEKKTGKKNETGWDGAFNLRNIMTERTETGNDVGGRVVGKTGGKLERQTSIPTANREKGMKALAGLTDEQVRAVAKATGFRKSDFRGKGDALKKLLVERVAGRIEQGNVFRGYKN